MIAATLAAPTLSSRTSARGVAVKQAPRAAALRQSRGPVAARADLSSVIFQLAEYGDVDAPIGAIVGGAVVVTGISLASTFAFKSGFEESEKMKERDKEYFGKPLPKGGINANNKKKGR